MAGQGDIASPNRAPTQFEKAADDLKRIAILAEREAAAKMSPADRARFDLHIEEANLRFRAVPIRHSLKIEEDSEKSRAWKEDMRKRSDRARHFSTHPKEWRKALRALRRHVNNSSEWTIAIALEIEKDPALLAFWLGGDLEPIEAKSGTGLPALSDLGPSDVELEPWSQELPEPLIVRDGLLPAREDAAEFLARLETLMRAPGRGGGARPLLLGANFDAAVFELFQAWSCASGRHGREAYSIAASNAARGDQHDAGPAVRFVRGALKILDPDAADRVGPHSISNSVRRIRETLHPPPSNTPP